MKVFSYFFERYLIYIVFNVVKGVKLFLWDEFEVYDAEQTAVVFYLY